MTAIRRILNSFGSWLLYGMVVSLLRGRRGDGVEGGRERKRY